MMTDTVPAPERRPTRRALLAGIAAAPALSLPTIAGPAPLTVEVPAEFRAALETAAAETRQTPSQVLAYLLGEVGVPLLDVLDLT